MSEGRSSLFTPFVSRILLIVVGIWIAIILLLIITGNFVPFMTSELTQFGICLSADALEVIEQIPPGTEILYICGELEGDTYRDIGIYLLYEEQVVYYRSHTLGPNAFYVPVSAGQIFPDVTAFPPAAYEVWAAYGRDPSIVVPIEVQKM